MSDELTLLEGDALERLRELAAGSVQCCVTSPPYWGLRDYGTAAWEGGDASCDHVGPPKSSGASTLKNDGRPIDRVGQNNYEREAFTPFREECGKCGAKRVDSQLGLERTPEEYVAKMVEVFREVKRVLRKDGTLWLNLGDSYTSGGRETRDPGQSLLHPAQPKGTKRADTPPGLKPKDLCGIPWRVAFALQADGWWLRSDIIWAKPNPMPESVCDRPTKSHEYLFLLTKNASYFYDAEAIKEKSDLGFIRDRQRPNGLGTDDEKSGDFGFTSCGINGNRNKRSVWTVSQNYDNLTEWIGKIGFCQRCGGVRVAGSGPDHITGDTEDSAGADRPQTNSQHTESPTKSWSAPYQQDLQLTIFAETTDASIQPILKSSLTAKTSSEEIRSQRETLRKLIALKDTHTAKKIRISVETENGSVVNVCACDQGDNAKKSVWRVATAPYPESHFATFPPDLIKPCILAGTSAKGCCAKCGAPWERITESEKTFESGSGRAGNMPNGKQDLRASVTNSTPDIRLGPVVSTKTLGWQPTCPHADAPVEPCTVLDCFGGSGTTGAVALELGRKAVLIELNPKYVELIEQRCDVTMGLQLA